MARIIVFDVNETLLDVQVMAPAFARTFGDGAVLSSWFAQLLQLSNVATITRHYRPFTELGFEALTLIAKRQGVELTPAGKRQILSQMQTLPPHSEVPAALQRLQASGLRLATLTNSPPASAEAKLKEAGLYMLFEQVLTVEPVRLFKPAAATYEMAAAQFGVTTGSLRMVAAHNWDTTGAIRAGCAAAFIARPRMFLGALDETPDIVGPDLDDVATQIIARELV